MSDKIVRNVLLRQKDFDIVKLLVEKKGLGEKGFSAALRIIIREWYEIQLAQIEEKNSIESGSQPISQNRSFILR